MSFADLFSVGIWTKTGIDAKTVATTEIFVVPTGYKMIVHGVVIQVTAFTSGGKSTQAVASFGGNSATYDDYINSATYTVAAVDVALHDEFAEASAFPVYAAGTSFRVAIETGSNATTETWTVHLLYHLVEA